MVLAGAPKTSASAPADTPSGPAAVNSRMTSSLVSCASAAKAAVVFFNAPPLFRAFAPLTKATLPHRDRASQSTFPELSKYLSKRHGAGRSARLPRAVVWFLAVFSQ